RRAAVGACAGARRRGPLAPARGRVAAPRRASVLALRLPVPGGHLPALPVLRMHPRVRRRRAPASAPGAAREPPRRSRGWSIRGACPLDRAAPVRPAVRAGGFPGHAPRPARRGGDAGVQLGVPGPARRPVIGFALLASYLAGSVP